MGVYTLWSHLDALEEAVELNPDFVRAWAELAGVLSFRNFTGLNLEYNEHAEQALEHVRMLAPASAEYLIAQAYYIYYIWKHYKRAYEVASQAELMKPSDTQVLRLKSWIQRRLEDFDGSIESIQNTRRLDPRNPI